MGERHGEIDTGGVGVMGGAGGLSLGDTKALMLMLSPPQHFCSMVIKIIAVQIAAMGVRGDDRASCRCV